jgi:triosephosphate isomerase
MTRGLTYPLVAINFKTYVEATGEGAVRLAKVAEDVSLRTGVCVAVAPQYSDLYRVSGKVKIPILAQHVDHYDPGAHTGSSCMEAAKEAGAIGSLVNHSEHMLKLSEIDLITQKMRQIGLTSVVCTNTTSVSAAVAALGPDVIAIEPPELIGTGIPVSKAKPEIVSDTVAIIRKINPKVQVLCGAGITKGEDVAAASRLGASGVLMSSGFVKARDPLAALTDLANGAKS